MRNFTAPSILRRALVFKVFFALVAPAGLAEDGPRPLAEAWMVHAFTVQDHLAYDRIEQARTEAVAMGEVLDAALSTSELDDTAKAQIANYGAALAAFAEIETAPELRLAYEAVSQPLVEFVRADGARRALHQLYFCPMAKKYKFWVQPKPTKPGEDNMANPFMGKASGMLTCGVKKKW